MNVWEWALLGLVVVKGALVAYVLSLAFRVRFDREYGRGDR